MENTQFTDLMKSLDEFKTRLYSGDLEFWPLRSKGILRTEERVNIHPETSDIVKNEGPLFYQKLIHNLEMTSAELAHIGYIGKVVKLSEDHIEWLSRVAVGKRGALPNIFAYAHISYIPTNVGIMVRPLNRDRIQYALEFIESGGVLHVNVDGNLKTPLQAAVMIIQRMVDIIEL